MAKKQVKKLCIFCKKDKAQKHFRKKRGACRACEAYAARLRRYDNPIRSLLTGAKTRSKRKNIKFDIEESDIVIPDICPVLGIPLILFGPPNSPHLPSIDRIDNNKGYEKNNIAIISFKANSLKSNASLNELKQLVKYCEDHTNK